MQRPSSSRFLARHMPESRTGCWRPGPVHIMDKLTKAATVAGIALLLTGTRISGPKSIAVADAVEASREIEAPRAIEAPREKGSPELPRATVEIPHLKTTGRTIHVPAGGNLQRALDEAKGGDRIELEPRATYEGPFRLKPKDGEGWIVITSSAAPPPTGRHVQPSDAAQMPRLVSAGDFVIAADPGAHHFRFVAVEIAPKAGSFVNTLVQFGADETSADKVPHHLIVDRCYLHGDSKVGGRRGIAMNARYAAVIDSY